jgi:chorismate mutase
MRSPLQRVLAAAERRLDVTKRVNEVRALTNMSARDARRLVREVDALTLRQNGGPHGAA